MSALPPDANVLGHLERIGERLRAADCNADAVFAREHLTVDERRRQQGILREAAQERANRDLDGAYSVSWGSVHLIRALQAMCEVEAVPGTARGNQLRDAAHCLRRAGAAMAQAVARQEIDAGIAEAQRKAREQYLAALAADELVSALDLALAERKERAA